MHGLYLEHILCNIYCIRSVELYGGTIYMYIILKTISIYLYLHEYLLNTPAIQYLRNKYSCFGGHLGLRVPPILVSRYKHVMALPLKLAPRRSEHVHVPQGQMFGLV